MADDLEPEYLDHRDRLTAASAGQELIARMQARQSAEAATAPPRADVESDLTLSDLITGNRPQPSLAKRFRNDILVGATETPRAVVKGVRDAVQSTINLGSELGGWLEEHNLGGGVIIDKEGVRFASGEELSSADVVRPADTPLPDLAAPKTVTGGVVKGVAQFLTGMKGAGKLLDMARIPAMTGRSAIQGALANFAAFDPHQQRLSNLVEQFPALQNPVTEFLASNPNDNAAEGRLKNSLEGIGLGLVRDGFVKSLKLLRQASVAKRFIEGWDKQGPAPELAPDAFRGLGNEAADAPLVSTKTVAAGVKSPSGAEGPDIEINFARINAPEDVKKAMQGLADAAKGSINDARRGTQSLEQTKLDAAQVDAWDALVKRRAGGPLNAEQSVAARQLWVSSTDRLTQLAQQAADAPSEANLFAFRKMLSVHDAIQREVIAARTETARALSSWRIPVGSNVERLRDITGALEASGGTAVARELANRVAALGKAGMVNEMAAVVEKGAYATTRDAVLEAWINGLLSHPATHMANTVSNTSIMFQRMAERAVGAKIASVLGDANSVAASEASAQFFGLTQGLRDAFRYAWKAARTGETGYGLNKLETAREGAITSEAFKLSSSGWLGRGVDLMGSLIRMPGRLMSSEDEFFKTLGYRMELSAQALRQATREVTAGKISSAGLKARIAEIIADPPQNVRLEAIDAATYQTFTNTPGKLAQTLSGLTGHYPALKVILPFVRTPANIMRYTFERTPLAPVMSQFRQNIAAGGARRDLALAQLSIGTMGMLAVADATMSGQVTGRGPVEKGARQALMREGWQPYSMKIGNRWVTYNRLDPVGSLIGMSADTTEALMHGQHEAMDDPDTENLVVASTVAFAGNLVNKTYLSGLSGIITALNEPQMAAEGWAQRLAGSLVPAGVAGVERLEDPTVREVNSIVEAIRARTPGLSEKLPPKLDLWGEPVTTESGYGAGFDALSPATSRKPSPEPIDRELLRIESNVTMPRRRVSFNGATVDLSQYPGAYSRYVQLAGNELKHPAWNLGAKDLLNQIVTGEHPLSAVYRLRSDGPDGGKDIYIRDILRQYQDLARTQLLQEYPQLAEDVGARQTRRREIRMPRIG